MPGADCLHYSMTDRNPLSPFSKQMMMEMLVEFTIMANETNAKSVEDGMEMVKPTLEDAIQCYEMHTIPAGKQLATTAFFQKMAALSEEGKFEDKDLINIRNKIMVDQDKDMYKRYKASVKALQDWYGPTFKDGQFPEPKACA